MEGMIAVFEYEREGGWVKDGSHWTIADVLVQAVTSAAEAALSNALLAARLKPCP
jgi:hypothetical protein